MTTFRAILPRRRDERGLAMRAGDPFLSLHTRVNGLVDDLLHRDWMPFGLTGRSGAEPRMDVVETSEEFRVELELPGVAEADVQVSLDDDVLTIRGEKKAEERSDKDGLHRVERTFGSFERRVGLSAAVDAEQAEATFDKGVLTVRLPKRPEEQAKTRTIPVRSTASGTNRPD